MWGKEARLRQQKEASGPHHQGGDSLTVPASYFDSCRVSSMTTVASNDWYDKNH